MSLSSTDFASSETADAVRDTTACFAADRILPIAVELDAENRFRRAPRHEMGRLGLHGIAVEGADGGFGLGYLEPVVAMAELSCAPASIGLSYATKRFLNGREQIGR